MSETPPSWPRPEAHVPVHPVLWLMVGVMVLLEVMPAAAEQGWLPQVFHRVWVYTFLAFFDAQFELALHEGVVEPQLLWSLVTYAFVHGGLIHLGLNAAVFLALGHTISRAIGIARTVALFAVTAAAGALTFALMADAQGPLVGASGAVFGFLGTVCVWRLKQLRALGLSPAPVLRLLIGLAVINVALALGLAGLGGALAWEAHLGGFVAGWLIGRAWPPGIRLADFR